MSWAKSSQILVVQTSALLQGQTSHSAPTGKMLRLPKSEGSQPNVCECSVLVLVMRMIPGLGVETSCGHPVLRNPVVEHTEGAFLWATLLSLSSVFSFVAEGAETHSDLI